VFGCYTPRLVGPSGPASWCWSHEQVLNVSNDEVLEGSNINNAGLDWVIGGVQAKLVFDSFDEKRH